MIKFYMRARWRKGASSDSTRFLGLYSSFEREGCLTLVQARARAREWEALRVAGTDPKQWELELALAALERVRQRRECVFSAVVEIYLVERKKVKSAAWSEGMIRRYILCPDRNHFLNQPIGDVDSADVSSFVDAITKHSKSQALQIFQLLKQIFAWVMRPDRRKRFQMLVNPMSDLRLQDFELSKSIRTNMLSDEEIAAFWYSCKKLGYPFGSLFLALLLVGTRLSNMARSQRSQFELENRMFVIPQGEFKSQVETKLPLSDLAVELFSGLSAFTDPESGPYLFSSTHGTTPVSGFHNSKEQLEKLMHEMLRRIAIARNRNPNETVLKPFVLHDLRRVVRTKLSALGIHAPVAEAALGHGKKGLARVYDQYAYLEELKVAMQKYADEIKRIVADYRIEPDVDPKE
ncbi:tyrosine-type recombinase/integrase [Mesorhizobium sp. KR1-2]|uniref:tyrosine-type recombinase/integrase n=1 Tax=Mesorhizobium sp. KR1-2 TaxID=3156609 RepID=UPI0032B60D5E